MSGGCKYSMNKQEDNNGHEWKDVGLYAFCKHCGLGKQLSGPHVRCRGPASREERTRVVYAFDLSDFLKK